jgi:hypothetical protein
VNGLPHVDDLDADRQSAAQRREPTLGLDVVVAGVHPVAAPLDHVIRAAAVDRRIDGGKAFEPRNQAHAAGSIYTTRAHAGGSNSGP